MASAMDLSEYENDPRLFLFTSLTAGSSHIITATSRLETILKANKIPFQAIDTATDEKARRLWQRRAQKKKLPGLVKDGFVIGDLEEIEEWNEFGELKENIGPVPANNAAPSGTVQGVNIRPPEATSPRQVSGGVLGGSPGVNKAPKPLLDKSKMVPLPGAAEMAERNKQQQSTSNPVEEPPKVETATTAPAEKEASFNAAKALLKEDHPGVDHLSAPPSAMQSGTVTPHPEPAAAAAEEEGKEAMKAEPDSTSTAVEEKAESESTSAAVQESDEPPPPRRQSITHRGSEVLEATPEEIKKIESESALKEEDEDDDDGGEATNKSFEGLSVKDGEKPQDQDAKEGEDATKSVQD